MQARLYQALSGADAGEATERRNFFLHAASLALTKVADGLIDPKIVLSWLVTALGAPAAFVGFLVPIREAGALAPQLLIAPFVRAAPVRKWFWAIGSVGQGTCVAGIAAVALTMEGAAAGWAILALLALFSVCRAVCSVSHKDVLGKTVKKSTRGAATGIASSAAAIGTLTFGTLLALAIIPRTVTALAIVIAVAGVVGASILSGYVWGRLSDQSSRWTFILGGGLAAIVLAVAAVIATGSPSLWVVTAMLFVAQIGYEGVRTARKIHLVDMADEDKRAVYTALSNTLIGFVLIAGGVLGVIAQVAGIGAALAVSSALCLAGIAVAHGLDEVQSR
jgi:hypothetical protein